VTIWKIEQTPQSLVALLDRYRTNGRYPIVGGANLADVGPPAKVAVLKLWRYAVDDLDRLHNWAGAQAILKMDIDPSLREEILRAAMYSGSKKVRDEAFNLAVTDACKKAADTPGRKSDLRSR
jgi:hypothetical protein